MNINMEWYAIGEFKEKVKQLREFLTELAARKDEIEFLGLKKMMHMENFEATEGILADFSVNLFKAIESARFVDKTLFDRLNQVVDETKLDDSLAHFRIQLDLAKRQRVVSPLIRAIRSISFKIPFIKISTKETSLFTDESLSINKVLVSLSRLESLLSTLSDLAWERVRTDDDIFKPSNIDVTFICKQIEEAIADLDKSETINKAEKDRLIIYLNDAKLELTKSPPSWKQVVGALVILSTILSGIANAPKAIDNVNTAIKHILGTSIERKLPDLLPPPREIETKTPQNKLVDI